MSNKWDFLRLPLSPNDENFDVYWRWIFERYGRFERRLAGAPLAPAPPGDKFLTALEKYSFCIRFASWTTGVKSSSTFSGYRPIRVRYFIGPPYTGLLILPIP